MKLDVERKLKIVCLKMCTTRLLEDILSVVR